MEILQSYNFQKPSRSQYAPVVKALLEDGAPIVKLKRGEDFPSDAKIESVQGAVTTQIRQAPANTNRRIARTFTESDDALIVTLWPEGQGPKARKKAAKREKLVL